MSSKLDYTNRARNIAYRFPKFTFIGTQVVFWIVAFLLYATLMFLNNLYLSYMGKDSFLVPYWVIVLASVLMGILYGIILAFIDIWIDRQRLGRLSAGRNILIKAIIYPIVLFIIIGFIRYGLYSHLNNYFDGIYTGLIESHLAWRYLYLALLIYSALMSAAISFINHMNSSFGPGVIIPLLLGRYKRPREEERFFMFLDLKSSTAHAEKLGHLEYSSLIKDCFSDLNQVLTKNYAEVYQYVGDEVVISWHSIAGLKKLACLSLFFDFRDELSRKKDHYIQSYGFIPEFKAGLHFGMITAVEVGHIKREIAYHGDTINTAARIQAECNKLDKTFLISDTIISLIPQNNTTYNFGSLGNIPLKGKDSTVELFYVETD